MTTFEKRTRIERPARELADWHFAPGALERLTPPWVTLVESGGDPDVSEGSVRSMTMRVGPVPMRWVARHRDVVAGEQFVDEALKSPFASWVHRHRFIEDGDRACVLEDHVDYALPMGALGRLAAGWKVRSDLERLFDFRHRRTEADLVRHGAARDAGVSSLRVAITGASGFVGGALADFLRTGGHDVVRLVRRTAGEPDERRWDPLSAKGTAPALEGVDAVVHLAGAGIASSRWTEARKAVIRDSRALGTRAVAEAIAACDDPPKVLVSASAIGFYGARGEETVDESAPAGTGFLAETCQEWEAAAEPARAAGVRVVTPRIGIVLGEGGGALEKMMLPFLMGLGGRLGSGRQWMSWIALDDLVGLLHRACWDESFSGVINAVSPNPVRNEEFTRVLARVLNRPALAPAPAFALKVLLGPEMAEAMLLTGARVLPSRLQELGFDHRTPDLEQALRVELGRQGSS